MALKVQSLILPCVKWQTRLPDVHETRKSPVFTLGESDWQFEIRQTRKLDKKDQNSEEWLFYLDERESPRTSRSYTITSYIEGEKGKYTPLFSVYSKDYLFYLKRSYLLKEFGIDGDEISLMFQFDLGSKCETDILEPTNKNRKEIDSGRVSIQALCFEKVLDDISKLYDNKEHSDVVLQSGNRRFSAHRNVLSARSEVFAAMFRNSMAESKTGVVHIVDMEPSVLRLFLLYVYSGRIDELSLDAAVGLYEAAEKYCVQLLKRVCSCFILDNLSEEVACRVLHLADQYGDSELLDGAISFVSSRGKFLKTAEWRNFAEQRTDVAMKVFFKFTEAIDTEG